MREKLGFVGFAGFYLASPIVLPQPWPYFLDETTNLYALGGLITLAVVIAVGLRVTQWITRDMTPTISDDATPNPATTAVPRPSLPAR